MKKGSIVFKLFTITTLIFLIFLFLFIISQTMFFKSFYLNEKVSSLKKNLQSFSSSYEKNTLNNEEIIKKVNEFANKNNAQIAILDKSGDAKYSPAYEIVLKTAQNKNISIPLSNIAYLEEFQKLRLTEGAEIVVEGYFDSNKSNIILLHSIKKDKEKWENTDFKTTNISVAESSSLAQPVQTFQNVSGEFKTISGKSGKITTASNSVKLVNAGLSSIGIDSISAVNIEDTKISGKIVELNIPTQIEQMSDYNKGILWSSIEYWKQLVNTNKIKLELGKTSAFHYFDFLGRDNLAFVQPVAKDKNNSEFIFAISSMQPVGEAVDAMKAYYVYVFAAALIIIMLMALLYSRIIARPLIKMNQVAGKMANLDFSEECNVKSKDELGNLAQSLNNLSKNLGRSMGELKRANEQLTLDIEKERNLEVMRKEFVSSVSHEFKTPLGIMKGFAEGLKDNVAESKKSYYVDVILDEIEKMDELVLDLLDLAKLESRAYKLNIEEFCIVELIDGILNRLLGQINEKNILLIPKFESKILKVSGDYRKIEQVVTNILTNAIRHTEYGGYIIIEVETEEKKASVSVENSGSHINEEDLPKIWDRFYRVEKSRDKKTGGTGLGLCIVKNILELHESKYGALNTAEGVKFYFTLNCI